MISTKTGLSSFEKSNIRSRLSKVSLIVRHSLVLVAMTGSMLNVLTGILSTLIVINYQHNFQVGVENKKSGFKPDLIEPIGQGGYAKVFKARFHGSFVAMKYIPLDKVKDEYAYKTVSYGLHEYFNQVKVFPVTL